MSEPQALPNLGLFGNWPDGYNGWGAENNLNLRMLDAVIFAVVLAAPQNAPPGSPSQGDRYIVGTAPTGAWAGQANALTVYTTDETGTALWDFFEPRTGFEARIVPSSGSPTTYIFQGGAWVEINDAGSSTFAGLSDVEVTEGAPISNYMLVFSSDGTKVVAVPPITNFGRSGLLHAAGLVPDPGSVAGASKYLREDGSWSQPFFGTSPMYIYNDTIVASTGASTLTLLGGLTATLDTANAQNVFIEDTAGGGGGGNTVMFVQGSTTVSNADAGIVVSVGGGLVLTGSTMPGVGMINDTNTGGGGGALGVALAGIGSNLIGQTAYRRPALSSMTRLYPSGGTDLTVVDVNASGALVGPLSSRVTGNSGIMAGYGIAHGRTGEFAIYGLISCGMMQTQPSSGIEQIAGIGLYDSASGNSVIIGGTCSQNNQSRLLMQASQSDGSASGNWGYGNVVVGPGKWAGIEAGTQHWQKLVWNGSTYDWYISINGYVWQLVMTGIDLSSIFSDVPDQMCFLSVPGAQNTRVTGLDVWELFADAP